MPATPNPEIALLEQKLKDLNTERQRVHRDYAIAHDLIHISDDMIRSRHYNPPQTDADARFLRDHWISRKVAAEQMKEARGEMEDLLAQRIEIKRQVSVEDCGLRTCRINTW